MFPNLVIALLLVVTPQLFILYGINISSSLPLACTLPGLLAHGNYDPLVPIREGYTSL